MSTQSNIAASRRMLEECFNEGMLDTVDQICAPDVVTHDPALPEDARGTQAIKDQVQMYRTAFSDLEMTVDDVFASRDEVVIRWTSKGTNDGEMMGMPATGRHATVTGISIDRFDAAGRITENWTEWDNLGLLQQLGVAQQAMAQST
jgi:steroid delta-isomerase-like uncharacterized protein